MEDCAITAAIRAQLAAKIGTQRYDLWFGSHTILRVGQDRLTVSAASTFVRDWLRRHFLADLRACVSAVVGREIPVEFEIGAASPPLATAETVQRSPQPVPRKARPTLLAEATPCTTTTPAHVDPSAGAFLSDFEVGPSNEYAYRLAQMVVAPGPHKASPVLLFGMTGVGKTHLLRAIRSEFQRRHRRSRAIYLTSEQFTTEFIEALRGSGLPSFRQKCRGAHLLIIDDLQFFAGKRATLEELLHTIDTLLVEGRQLVLAGDRSLRELHTLGAELVSRLSGGLVCEIEPPEFATRRGILHRLSKAMNLSLDGEVISMVAAQITAGARELRGALHRLHTISLAEDRPVSCEMAQRALVDLAQQCTRAVRLADVEQAVCDVFGVQPSQLRSQRKGRSVSDPRMLAMWLARKYTRAAWSEIGQFFGRRSHSTVISAHRRVQKLIDQQGQIGVSDQHCSVEDAIRRVEAALRTA